MTEHDPAVEPCRICGAGYPHRIRRDERNQRLDVVCHECSALLESCEIKNLGSYLAKVWKQWKLA